MGTSRDRAEFMFGKRDVKYGVYDSTTKKFKFGVCEDSPMLAQARLHFIIGDDAKKWRFQFKPIPPEIYLSEEFISLMKRYKR